MIERAEHQMGWHRTIKVDDREIGVRADHSRHRRPPRPHDVAMARCRGRPATMVETMTYSWAVTDQRGRATTLTQLDNGVFHVGSKLYPRMDILQAAAAAYRDATRRRAPPATPPAEAAGADETGSAPPAP